MAKEKSSTVGAAQTTSILLTPKGKIEELAKLKRNTKKRVQSMNGTYGEEVKKLVEDHHLDRKAFGISMQLDALSDEALHMVYFNLLYYMDVLGITKRATAQEEMFDPSEQTGEVVGRFSDSSDAAEDQGHARKPRAAANGNGKDKKNGKKPGAAAKPKGGSRKKGADNVVQLADARTVEEAAGAEKH